MMGGGMMGGFGPGFGGFGLIGLLFNIAIIIGIVVLVVWAVRQFSRPNNSGSQTASHSSIAGATLSAREILDVRYARGELTREEYQNILGDIA
jgi:putative membrane protein